MRRAAPLAAFALVAAAALAALLPLCAVLHRCGCRAPWAGGIERCNVRQPSGPHCPWCEHDVLGGAALAGSLGGPGLAFWAVRRARRGLARATLLALAALPPSLLLTGALVFLATDYPHFLVEGARERLGLPAGPFRTVHPTGPTGSRRAPACHGPDRGRSST